MSCACTDAGEKRSFIKNSGVKRCTNNFLVVGQKNTQVQSAKADKELHIYIIEANRESNIMHSSQKKSEKIKMQKKYIEHKEERM